MNRRHFITRALLLVIAIFLPLANGCALIPLATVGTLFDIAGSAATTGPAVYKMGKLDIAFMAEFPAVQQAVRAAVYDLRLIVLSDQYTDKTQKTWQLKVEDNLHTPITITVDRLTPMLCHCRVDVGLFGSETTAKMLMTRISSHIPATPTAKQIAGAAI